MNTPSSRPDRDSLIALKEALDHLQNYSYATLMGGDEQELKDQFFVAAAKLSPHDQYDLYTTMLDSAFNKVMGTTEATLAPLNASMQERADHLRKLFTMLFDMVLEDERCAKKIAELSERALKDVNGLLGITENEDEIDKGQLTKFTGLGLR